MSKSKHDFGGYATKVNLKCADGRIILKDAFKGNDGMTVPLVWQHMHNEPANVLGHALLENRSDGVYIYGLFNETEAGENAKLLVQHGDITALSIYANSLIEKAKTVIHGVIREVSLVLSGSNPGALIDNLTLSHADGSTTDLDDEAIIYTGLTLDTNVQESINHADTTEDNKDEDDETVGDVFNTLSEKQKMAVYALIGEAIDNPPDEEGDESVEHSNLEEEVTKIIMKKNVFDGKTIEPKVPTLTHDQFQAIVVDAQKCGSFKEAFLAHAGTYGIDNIDYLFPDAQAVSNEPDLITREMSWVFQVINGTRHSAFSRIKSLAADITVETARALGYVTGALKKEEVFGLLQRVTTPTTIYKKQKLDRDDIVDITDLDVVAWLKREMRMMLDEELARAVLVSDGRAVESADKIDETHIRPIWKDDALYAHKVQLLLGADVEDIIDAIITARTNYKGSGSPALYTTSAFLTSMLLLKDTQGYRIYKTEAELAAALRVSKIVEVPVMDGLIREAGATDYALLGIIVNLKDYTMGADKGGAVSMFDDFDIDYNQYKYLLETRCSGTLTKPKSALVIEQATT